MGLAVLMNQQIPTLMMRTTTRPVCQLSAPSVRQFAIETVIEPFRHGAFEAHLAGRFSG